MNKTIFAAVLLMFFGLGLVGLLGGFSNGFTGSAILDDPVNEENILEGLADVTFDVKGDGFSFFVDGLENPELKVKKGDKVRINFESTGGFHDFVIDEFSVATEKLSEGENDFIEFVASESGSFEYYCSVGSHREKGMKGMFIVE